MSSEEAVPEEIWGLIFGKVESVRDMGRLARVNRLFNRLVTNAITQVRAIRIGQRCISLKTQLWVDGEEELAEDRFVKLRRAEKVSFRALGRAVSLVEKVAREAQNLESVVLDLDWSHYMDQELCPLVSQCLRLLTENDKPKLKAFRLLYMRDPWHMIPGNNNILAASLAEFLASKAATLKNLSLDIEDPLPPPFLQALQSCTQLETVKLLFRDIRDHNVMVVLDSVLAGVHGLKSLQLRHFPNPTITLIHVIRKNDLRSLRHLDCYFKTLVNYVSTCQASKPRGQRFSMGDHPLQNIQELTLAYFPISPSESPSFFSSFPYEDFPQLRLLHLNNSLYAIELPPMVAHFLSLFRHQLGPEKALELQVECLWVNREKWLEDPPLDDGSLAAYIQDAVGCYCPTLASDPKPSNKKPVFQRGNATFSIKVESYYGRI